MPPDLERLMERYADGDAEAFDALYDLLRPVIRSSLWKWLHTGDKVEDALQITFLKLHASRARYRRGAPVIPWVVTIARNVAIDHLRSAATTREVPIDEEMPAEPSSGREPDFWTAADEQEVASAVRAAVEELPASMRDVVRLHKLEGRPMKEVAAILGIKESATRVRAHRGYRALARLLMGLRTGRTR